MYLDADCATADTHCSELCLVTYDDVGERMKVLCNIKVLESDRRSKAK